MAVGNPAGIQGRDSPDVRRLDHLEASLLEFPEWPPDTGRRGIHAAIRKSGHHFHMVRAYAVVAFASVSVSEGFIALAARGHW